jgi:hypothetical protein
LPLPLHVNNTEVAMNNSFTFPFNTPYEQSSIIIEEIGKLNHKILNLKYHRRQARKASAFIVVQMIDREIRYEQRRIAALRNQRNRLRNVLLAAAASRPTAVNVNQIGAAA